MRRPLRTWSTVPLLRFIRSGVSLVFFLGFADKNLGDSNGVGVVAGGAHLPLGADDRSFLLAMCMVYRKPGLFVKGIGALMNNPCILTAFSSGGCSDEKGGTR